jgi:hypothetical protein
MTTEAGKEFLLTKIYIHGDEDSLYEDGIDRHELSKSAAEVFSRCAYELTLTVLIDKVTGDVFVKEFENVPLERAVKLT